MYRRTNKGIIKINTPVIELDLGMRAAERERYVIEALKLYKNKNGYTWFHMHVPEAIAGGNSAWGHLPYPQERVNTKNDWSKNRDISRAVNDLKNWGIFEQDAQYHYRTHSDFYRLRENRIKDIEFGLYASKRIYRVLAEISKYQSIKDYKLFGRTVLSKGTKHTKPIYVRRWKCKIRGYYFSEIDDLIEYGFITTTDGSKGYKLYTITAAGKAFMVNNQQYLNEDYRI